MEYVEDDAGTKGASGVALMRCNMKHLPRLQNVGNARYRKLEGAAQEKGPLLVAVGVVGDDGTGGDVDPALGYMLRVDIAATVARSDFPRCNGSEVV
jgi:hypothetical protein